MIVIHSYHYPNTMFHWLQAYTTCKNIFRSINRKVQYGPNELYYYYVMVQKLIFGHTYPQEKLHHSTGYGYDYGTTLPCSHVACHSCISIDVAHSNHNCSSIIYAPRRKRGILRPQHKTDQTFNSKEHKDQQHFTHWIV